MGNNMSACVINIARLPEILIKIGISCRLQIKYLLGSWETSECLCLVYTVAKARIENWQIHNATKEEKMGFSVKGGDLRRVEKIKHSILTAISEQHTNNSVAIPERVQKEVEELISLSYFSRRVASSPPPIP